MNTETDEDLGGFERRLLHQLVLHDAARPQQRTRPRSQHRRFGRPAVVAVALVAVVAVGGAATAASYFDDQHDLAVAGTQTYAGGPIYVKGNGCGPGAVVEVALDGTRLGQITADGGGAFNADLIVPAIAGEGSHIVTASCPQADGKGLSQRVTVTVAARPSPELVRPDFAIAGSAILGGEFVVKGAGCAAGATVTFSTLRLTIGQVVADSDGAYAAVLSASGLSVGDHVITAACVDRSGNALTLTQTLAVTEPTGEGDPGPKPTVDSPRRTG
jgi:hypothetical protein